MRRTTQILRVGGAMILWLIMGAVVAAALAFACALWATVRPVCEAMRMTERDTMSPPPALTAPDAWRSTAWIPAVVAPWGRPQDLSPSPRFGALEEAAERDWMESYGGERSFGREESLLTDAGFGVTVESLGMRYAAFDVDSATVTMLRAGWPLRAFCGTQFEKETPWSAWPPVKERDVVHPPAWLRPAGASAGAIPPVGIGGGRVVPIGVIWSGLLVNAAFFGAGMWVLGWGGGWALRARRRRLGRCVVCGYDRRGLGAGKECPECGAAEHASMY